MYYLIGITAICMVVAYFTQSIPRRKPGTLGQPVPNPLGFLIPAVLFTVFSGLRNNTGDTFYYIYSYELLGDNPDKPDSFFDGGAWFEWLQYYLKSNGEDAQVFIMICAIFACVPFIYSLYKNSYPYELSIYLFVATTYFALSMNGIRQYMASGILALAVKYMLSEKKSSIIPFVLFTLLAYMFHASALIMIPVYFLVRRKAWSATTLFVLLGSVFATIFFDSFLEEFLGALEGTEYENYSENGWFTEGVEQGASIVRVFVMAVPVVMSFLARERVALMGKKGDILTNLCVLNLAIYILSVYNWIFARLAVYTSVYFIIMMAWLVTEGFKKEQIKSVYAMCIAAFGSYFWVARYTIEYYESDYF